MKYSVHIVHYVTHSNTSSQAKDTKSTLYLTHRNEVDLVPLACEDDSNINGNKFNHGAQQRIISVDTFFIFLRLLFFCFVVAICALVHDVETISPFLCAKSIWKSFLKYE